MFTDESSNPSGSTQASPEPLATHETVDAFEPQYSSFDDVLEDLSTRFIMNLPDNELESLERMCFQVEQAHWFYEDFIRESHPQYPSLPLKKFSEMLFRSCPVLKRWSHEHEQAFDKFMLYKTRVPVCGAIMLNAACDKCVLVKGWKSSSGWGFPKGKINQDELPQKCAVREVLEETGYDLSKQINSDDVVVVTIRDQRISLFIVPGVPEDFEFQTRTRKEISKIDWFRLVDLPTWKRNKIVPGKFYLISPFVGPLRTFINERKARHSARRDHSQSREPRQRGHRTRNSHALASVDTETTRRNGTPGHDSVDIGSLDPHMARLLSGLSLSAQQDPPTPLPSLNMAASHGAPVETGLSRPSSTNPLVSALPSLHSHSASRENGVHDEPTRAHGAMGPQVNIAGKSESEARSSPQTTPRSAALSSAWSVSTTSTGSTPSDVPPRLAPSRQGGAHGDISPYLSRSTEIPTSGRRLKQLALLESVVDETTRRSAITRASTAMGMSDSTTRSLAPSASVPPSPIDARVSPYPIMYNHHHHMTPSPNMPRAVPSTIMHPPGPPMIPLHEASRPMHRPDASLEWNNGSQPWIHPRTHHQLSVYDQTPRQSFAPLPVRPNPGTLHANGGQPSQGGFFPGVAPPHHMPPYSAPYGGSPGRFGYADPPPPYADPRMTSGYPTAPNTVPLLPARLAYPSSGAPTASTVNLLSILNSPLPSSVQYNPTRTPTNPP